METNTGKRYETAMIAILYSKKRTAASRNDLLRAAAAVDLTVGRIDALFAADVQKLDSYRRGLTSPSTLTAVNDITINTALLSQQSHAVHVLIKNILGDEVLDKFVHLLEAGLLEAGCNVTGG